MASLLPIGTALAQSEAVTVKRPAQLRDAPAEAAHALVALPVQTAVMRLGDRQGPWIKVRTADGTQGWVHMFDVSAAAALPGATGSNALRSISSFFNKGSSQAQSGTAATATLGIRGLGAENLAGAQPNVAALAQMEVLRQDAAQARQFAGVSALASRPVDPLPARAAPAASVTPDAPPDR